MHTNSDKVFLILLTMTLNLLTLVTGDSGRTAFDPDLLGEEVKIERGSNLLNQIFNYLPDMYWRCTQMNSSASSYATL